MTLLPLSLIATFAVGVTLAPGASSAPRSGSTLVELRPAARCTEAAFVAGAGGTLVAPSLDLYRIPGASAQHVISFLRARHALRFSTPNRRVGTLAVTDFADPLVPNEWWRAAVGVDTLTPPGPGKPVTIVDAGIDTNHPEFLEPRRTRRR